MNLERVSRAVEQSVTAVVLALAVGITVVMLAQVFFRYVLNDSLQWSEEVSVWLMIWMVFIGGALLSARDEHMNVVVVLERLPPRGRAVMQIAQKVLSVVFLAFVVWVGIKMFNGTFHRISPSTGLSSRWAKLSLPAGSLLMLLLTLNSIALDVLAWRRRDWRRFETLQAIEPI